MRYSPTRIPLLACLCSIVLSIPLVGFAQEEEPPPPPESSESGEAAQSEEEDGISDVEITTEDGVVLRGRYYHAPGGSRVLAVILPNVDEIEDEFLNLVGELAEEGISSMLVYPRGTGRSTETASGSFVSYQDFDPTAEGDGYRAMVGDVGAILSHRDEDFEAEVVVASRISANAAAAYLSRGDSPVPDALVLVTPGNQLKGIELTAEGLERLPGGALVLYGSEDRYSRLAAGDLEDEAPAGKVQTLELGGGQRGADLLEADGAIDAILSFMESAAP